MKYHLFILFTASVSLASSYNPRPFDGLFRKRQASTNSSSLQVDLGYTIYEGYSNAATALNVWKGIRYASPPIGELRWQAPQPPIDDRSEVIQATSIPHQCPQASRNEGSKVAAVNETITSPGSEDCLFLNVFSPQNASNVPVFVWIHGGGYGEGNGGQDLSDLINTNNNGFVGVTIQYRLGAFGFLSSDEVNRFGVVNAGIRDQTFALQWVQSYIGLFGGNASQVTIAGESAGAGSVMLQTIAYGGTMGTSLFSNAVAASPYLPMQYNYNDWVPSQSYYAFASYVGCFPNAAEGSPAFIYKSIFSCLVDQPTEVLQNASAAISASGNYGTWGFLPVTDHKYIQDLPSRELQSKSVNGVRLLSGNNANEGPLFVPQNITNEDALISYLQDTFPLFSTDDISRILTYYPGPPNNASDSLSAIDYATSGYIGSTALNESSYGTGQQQRANNVYAETTFACPSYWLADAFTNNGRTAWKYQYSVPGALHGSDTQGYFGPVGGTVSGDFEKAFMSIWGNFIINNDPSIPPSIAYPPLNTTNSNSTSSDSSLPSYPPPNPPTTSWPAYNNLFHFQMDLNITGGQSYSTTSGVDPLSITTAPFNITEDEEPGLRNNFSLVDAFSWEGGRGVRCDFWRGMGGIVPE